MSLTRKSLVIATTVVALGLPVGAASAAPATVVTGKSATAKLVAVKKPSIPVKPAQIWDWDAKPIK